MTKRIIMHVDMDAFFASVEVLDDKSLKGKPIIVGGISDRGVVSTCSYEARKYGVKSAMPVYIAKKKCPHGIFLPVRYWRYKEISKEIFKIFCSLTPYVEPLSIDEAYLDLSYINEDPIECAKYIKQKVQKEIGLNLSIGISYNKFLAKLASDWNKPNGLKVITEEMIPELLFPLEISRVYGIGNKSVKRLNDIGVFNIEQLYNLPKELLRELMGKMGIEVYERIRGYDNREVVVERERKSIGRETTLAKDVEQIEELKELIYEFAKSISKTLKAKNISAKNVTIKIKTADFKSHTKSKTLNHYIVGEEDIFKEAYNILENLDIKDKIRLVGVSMSSFKEDKLEQISIFNSLSL
ncbi:DNA polymerase IV [Clostridium cellulovorans]|uniref:DNA polymerase IV n=1 Tax=Clostridium cellulovorans (strain ATCC 35296 / DSM 3052 / OCM 3 / 743B) TaxID=573061 RepID=D9SS58_CLOC7|nr:DNA polymerase IV [Clostridium cellulovorans]ADL52505.1 DNA-directed DNA polymerase [Clostridium cellulovorans 743B]